MVHRFGNTPLWRHGDFRKSSGTIGESFLFHLLSDINCFIVILIFLVFELKLGELCFANFPLASAFMKFSIFHLPINVTSLIYNGKVSLWNHIAQHDNGVNGPYDDVSMFSNFSAPILLIPCYVISETSW